MRQCPMRSHLMGLLKLWIEERLTGSVCVQRHENLNQRRVDGYSKELSVGVGVHEDPNSLNRKFNNAYKCFIIISILKHIFFYRGFGLPDKTSSPLRTVLRPRVTRIHSKLSVIYQHFIPSFLWPAGSLLCNYNVACVLL